MRIALLCTALVLVLANGAPAMDHSMMHHGDHDPGQQMMKAAEQAEPAKKGVAEETAPLGVDPRIQEIDAHMEKLDFLVDEIAEAETPEARRRLMRDHVTGMQGVVKEMQRLMWCCPPGGHAVGEGHEQHAMGMEHEGDMHHGGQEMTHQLDAIFQRMKIMQHLLGQIVEQQSFLLGELTAGPAN